ncbi:DNA topoisomerase [Arachis hypogaea]|nr:DNA topoisomerase [Arachis hypogaea]
MEGSMQESSATSLKISLLKPMLRGVSMHNINRRLNMMNKNREISLCGLKMRAVQLSTDHSTSIEEEVFRIRAEHPDDNQAILNDRVKGQLKVTRAFGAGFLKRFNFLGKDSIKYENTIEVELPVYDAILKFQKDKRPGDDLFDKLDTSKLNAHLKELMPGLTAKVFRTFNASITLDDMLNKETKEGDVVEKILVYQHANKQVAIICNHQRSVSKSHLSQIEKLTNKIGELQVMDLLLGCSEGAKDRFGQSKERKAREKISQTNAKIEKMERDMKTKEDLKTVALGTSKINYLDPRITVAWCKRNEVPIEKVIVGEIKHSQAAHVTNLWRDFSSELIVGKIKCF